MLLAYWLFINTYKTQYLILHDNTLDPCMPKHNNYPTNY